MTDIPNSTQLLDMAHREWKNRQERKNLNDMSSWTSGWITGFLSEQKPNWSKVREEKVRKEERERILKELEQTTQNNQEEIETDEGEIVNVVCVGDILCKVEELREMD